MIPDIKKILFASDLSRNAFHAFRYAMKIATKFDAKITILHVLEEVSEDAQLAILAYIDEEKRKELFKDRTAATKELIIKRLAAFSEREYKNLPECVETVDSIKISEGYPADEILKLAQELHCDAIIMGAHKKGITSYTYLGSVTQRVLQRARKPVFVIPLPEGTVKGILGSFEKLF